VAGHGNAPPLVILGLDVGDPDAIQRWVREGYLPAIASIMERGCWGRTAGIELVSEQGIWFTMFNGISRGRHGYYFIRQLKPGSYELELFQGRDTTVLPFWARFRGRDTRVAVIDVPDSYLLPGLSGIQLPNWAIHYIHPPYPACAEPPGLLKEVSQVFGPRMQVDNILRSNVDQDRRIYRRLLKRVEKKGVLCRHLLAQDRFDLIAIVFAETHTGTHQLWKYRPEGHNSPAARYTDLTHAIRDLYQAVDRELDRLLSQLPDEVNVFVMSATGMEDHYPSTGLSESFCRRLGYQAAPRRSGRSSVDPLTVMRRLLPEAWRIALSRHLPRMTQERLLARQFRHGTDWEKTTAFAVPSLYTSFLRVNLRGREPRGTIEPGREYEALLHELEEELKRLIDPVDGEPAVRKVTRAAEFGTSPPWSLPDLFVQWKPKPYFMPRLLHPRTELTQPVPGFFRDSEHSNTGFLAAAGPSIRGRGDIGEVSLLDIAPTLLAVMEESVPGDLTGKVIPAVIRGG
jgi:predicted AlkP superfamily phosphohydrolase/phosphomutase